MSGCFSCIIRFNPKPTLLRSFYYIYIREDKKETKEIKSQALRQICSKQLAYDNERF